MAHLFKYTRKIHHILYSNVTRHFRPLSSSTLTRNNRPSLLNYNHSFSFSTTPKDDTKSTDTQSTDTATDTQPISDTSSTTTQGTSSITDTPSKPTPKRVEAKPLIHIHDEESPQLSIQLPNRWPFKRLARKPEKPPEPLNMHEMTTFSGLPASQFAPSEADALRATADRATQRAKPKEQKRREARAKFYKRLAMILFCTPALLYIFDNRKAKKMAERRAEYIASSTSSDARSIRDMAKLNNAELMDLYHWILREECDNNIDAALTLDEFGKIFVNAVNVFKNRKEGTGNNDTVKDIRLSREYDDELTKRERKKELKWLTQKFETVKDNRLASKNKVLQPWDLNIFFTEYKLPSSNKIPLTTLFIALSQITTDLYYNKAEVAFRIFTQQIEETEPKISYDELVRLTEDMLITGHWTTDTLITRRAYFPSQFGILTSEEICDLVYAAAGIKKEEDGNTYITFEQYGNALLKLSEGRRLWESCFGFFWPKTYKPWLMVWYCSDRSKSEIAEKERKERIRLKKIEEREKRIAAKLEKQKRKSSQSESDELQLI